MYLYLKGNCIKLLLLQLTGNMLNFQLFIIIGANVVATTATNINLKLLPSTRTNSATTLETKGNISISMSSSSNSQRNIDDEAFVQFLKYVSQEQSFTTIVILTNWQYATTAATTSSTWQQNDYCVNLKYYMEYFQHHLENHKLQQQPALIPVILLQSQQSEYRLHKKFNSEFVTIICIPPPPPPSLPLPKRQVISKVIQNHLLRALSQNLLYLRRNRVILRMQFRPNEGEHLQNIEELLKYCHMEQIINIIIISYQFPYNDTVYYSYEKFPRFKIIKKIWLKEEDPKQQMIFPNQLNDLKGYKMFTLPDQIEPRSMVYNDSQGQQQICGYVGHFVRYFAKGLNATLTMPYEVKKGVPIFYSDILKLTRDHTLDIPASLTGPINGTDWSEFSYPFEIADWCVMLPVEAEISMAEIFLAVLNPYFIGNLLLLFICCTFLLLMVFKRISTSPYRLYLPDILINDKAFRAVLGQGFPFNDQNLDYFVVYIFILLFFTGLVVVTVFGVFLGSFMTSPPKNPPIRSFGDLEKSGTKLYISQSEYVFIYPSAYLKYRNLFHIMESFKEFVHMRNSLNNSQAYVITSSSWSVFAAQQQLFSRQLFRYTKDLCFSRYLHFYFILPMHSVFREPLQMFTLKAYSSGLFFHWFESSFHELVSLGRLSFEDVTEPRKLLAISVADLKLIFVGFYISLLVSVGIFVGELLVDRFKVWKNVQYN